MHLRSTLDPHRSTDPPWQCLICRLPRWISWRSTASTWWPSIPWARASRASTSEPRPALRCSAPWRPRMGPGWAPDGPRMGPGVNGNELQTWTKKYQKIPKTFKNSTCNRWLKHQTYSNRLKPKSAEVHESCDEWFRWAFEDVSSVIVLVLVIIFQSCVAVFGQVGHVLHPFVQLTSSLGGQWQHYISIFALWNQKEMRPIADAVWCNVGMEIVEPPKEYTKSCPIFWADHIPHP